MNGFTAWLKECFNAKGRWNRQKFWLYPLGFGLITLIPMILLVLLLGYFASSILETIGGVLVTVWYILLIYISVLSYMKRLRDLEKNPWMSILWFIPLVNIPFGIYCGFWKGTPGENKYGPDPLGGTAPMKVESTTETKITTKAEEL